MSDKSAPNIRLADEPARTAAVALLREGKLVALPTETVYGLAARADSEAAVAGIYRAKGRPDFNPLIVHVPSLAAAEAIAQFDDRARLLASAFWPGPLTLVLPLREGTGIAPAVTAGLPTIALRCPAHPVMQAVLAESGLPLAAPSANRSGAVSPTSAAHVAASLGAAVDLILDGGPTARGIESTIVAATGGPLRLLERLYGWSPAKVAQLLEQLIGAAPAALPPRYMICASLAARDACAAVAAAAIGVAPSALRTPISLVRSLTEYDRMP